MKRFGIMVILSLIIQVFSYGNVNASQTVLDEGFTGYTGSASAHNGWTLNGIATYTSAGNFGASSPSLKFDTAGDNVVSPLFDSSIHNKKLAFWIKNQGSTATSNITIEGSSDGGQTWSPIAVLSAGGTQNYLIPSVSATREFPLSSNINRVRFTYNKSGSGNVSIDDIKITGDPVVPPAAPTGVSATAGNGEATVSFVAPVNDGGSPITGYTVISSPGGLTASGTGSPITITGLTNGTAYTFTVKAMNGVGESIASEASSSVTPEAPATVPTDAATPRIDTQPADQTVRVGDNRPSLNVAATVNDGGTLSYQWYSISEENTGPSVPTIAQIRALPNNSAVTTEGVVTTQSVNSFYIQDETAGIYVFNPKVKQNVRVGDRVEINTGTKTTYNGLIQITNAEFTIKGNTGAPVGKETEMSEVGSHQSMLVTIKGVTVSNVNATKFNTTKDGITHEVYLAQYGVSNSGLANGDVIDITGISSLFSSKIQIYPRTTADIVKGNGSGDSTNIQTITSINNPAGTLLPGATSSTYLAPTNVEGTMYYYVVVRNTNNSVTGNKTATATSTIAKVTVNPSLPGDVAVTGVSLDQSALSLRTGGTAWELTATVNPVDATNKRVNWSSSDPTVATVSSTGVVTPVGAGTATITVASEADSTKTATCNVLVRDVLLGDVNMDGWITSADAFTVQRFLKGTFTLTDLQKDIANVNLDSVITKGDSDLIVSRYLGKIPHFPREIFP